MAKIIESKVVLELTIEEALVLKAMCEPVKNVDTHYPEDRTRRNILKALSEVGGL